MSDVLSIAPAAPAAPAPSAEPTIESLAALVPDSAILPDAPAPVDSGAKENTADASDAAKIQTTQPAEGEAPAQKPPAPAEAVDKEALERAETAARRAREGSRRYREMLEEQRKVQAEAQRAAREAEEARREAEEARKLREKWKKDPYAALKDEGMTDRELAERALQEGTPELEIKRMIQAQQEALAAERQRLQALEARLESERAEAARQQAEANFARIADNETAYPRLAQLSPQAQLAVARSALQQIANNGYDVAGLSDDQVAEACERFLAPKRGVKAPSAPTAKPAVAPAVNTLTNAVSTTRATAPRPWHELTEDEQIAQIAAALPDPG